jgi:lysozyme family protein
MNFEEAIRYVILDEGGYVNHKNDRGGETKYGISKRSYPNEDIKNLTVERAVEIYKRDFWDRSGVERLPFHLRYQVFDMCVNHGAHNAIRMLQRASKVMDDGKIGSNTIKASEAIKNVDLAHSRMSFFAAIVRNSTNQVSFLEGWVNRCFKVLKRTSDD